MTRFDNLSERVFPCCQGKNTVSAFTVKHLNAEP